MRLIFLNRFYWPEEPATGQLLTDLAESMADTGADVRVITSRPPGPNAPARERHRGVTIRRVPSTRWGSRGRMFGKAVDYASYYVGAWLALVATARRGDVVVAMTDPPLLGVGAWLAARLRGAHVVHWVQDVYPEIAIELSGHRWLGVLRPPRNAAWRHAEVCVTLGRDMAAVLATAGVQPSVIAIIPNAAPVEVHPRPRESTSPLRREWGLSDRFVVAYSGNLGRVHALDAVLATAAQLRGQPHIAFVFIGDGAQRRTLEAEVLARGLTNVQFRDAQPRSRLAETLAVADVHLVTVRPGCERYVFPSKFHGIMAAERPVLFIGASQGELAQRIRECGVGHTFTPEEPLALAATIARLAADPADVARLTNRVREFAATHESREAAVKSWLALFARLQASAGPLPSTAERQLG